MKKLLFLILLVGARLAWGQGGISGQQTAADSQGHFLGGSTITTFSDSACTVPVNTWTNQALTLPTVQGQTSFKTDGLGNFTFWAPPNVYYYKISGSNVSSTSCFVVSVPPLVSAGNTTSSAYVVSTRGDRQIILQDPDFEGSQILPPPGWQVGMPGGLQTGVTLSYETVTPAPGKVQSLKMTNTSINSGISTINQYSVVPGDTYLISGFAKSDGTGAAFIRIAFQTSNDTIVSLIDIFPGGTTSTSWISGSASGTVPATAIKARVLLENTINSSTVWFDDISVQKTNFPGTITASGGVGGTGSNFLSLGSTQAAIGFQSTSGGTDQKVWDIITTPTNLFIRTINDANNSNVVGLQFNRGTGTAITSINMPIPVLKGVLSDAYSRSTRGDRQIFLDTPDFEGTSQIPPPGWTLGCTGIGASETVTYESSTQFPNKTQSIKLATTSQFSGLCQQTRFSVVPGDTYSITGDMKSDGTGIAALAVLWTDKTGVQISQINTTTTSTSWVTQTATGTVPANAVGAFVVIANNSASQPSTVWFDQISVQKTNFLGGVTAPTLSAANLVSGNCVQATTGGQLTTTGAACGTSSGTITATGTPASGQGTFWSGATSVTASSNWLYSAASGHTIVQGTNGNDALYIKRNTDASPTGNAIHVQNNAANTDLFKVDVTGAVFSNTTVNAVTGYQVNGAATSGNVLRGNGTNFVNATLAASDLSNGVTGSGAVVLTNSPSISSPSTSGTDSGTETLNNKRVNTRAVAVADATSITPNSDTSDIVTQNNTQANGTLTINAPTGTPVDGQKLIIRIKTANQQTYSFNATYHFSTTVSAPVNTSPTKTDYLGCIWNATNSAWDVVAVDQGH